MKKSLVFLFALSGAVLAADYTWVGPEGGDWATSANWDLNNGYYPQSDSDHAIIGDNKSVIWSSCQYFGATNIVTLGKNSILTLTANGDLNVNTFEIGGGSKVNWSNDYALGFGRNLTINYGTFSADSYGQFNITTGQSLWYNSHTVSLVGTLDFANVSPGEGTIQLYTLSGGVNGLSVDYRGLNVINANESVIYEIKQVDNGVAIAYNVIPEPTTATMSLLALAGLAARRRRK